MSRIADPIDAGLTMIVGNRPRGRQPSREESEDSTDQGKAPHAPLSPAAPAAREPELLVLSDPAGTTFVVALAAGELPPVPPNPQEVKLRGGAWSPPDTGQRLTDRKV